MKIVFSTRKRFTERKKKSFHKWVCKANFYIAVKCYIWTAWTLIDYSNRAATVKWKINKRSGGNASTESEGKFLCFLIIHWVKKFCLWSSPWEMIDGQLTLSLQIERNPFMKFYLNVRGELLKHLMLNNLWGSSEAISRKACDSLSPTVNRLEHSEKLARLLASSMTIMKYWRRNLKMNKLCSMTSERKSRQNFE